MLQSNGAGAYERIGWAYTKGDVIDMKSEEEG